MLWVVHRASMTLIHLPQPPSVTMVVAEHHICCASAYFLPPKVVEDSKDSSKPWNQSYPKKRYWSQRWGGYGLCAIHRNCPKSCLWWIGIPSGPLNHWGYNRLGFPISALLCENLLPFLSPRLWIEILHSWAAAPILFVLQSPFLDYRNTILKIFLGVLRGFPHTAFCYTRDTFFYFFRATIYCVQFDIFCTCAEAQIYCTCLGKNILWLQGILPRICYIFS